VKTTLIQNKIRSSGALTVISKEFQSGEGRFYLEITEYVWTEIHITAIFNLH
jgi:hypothetical protein